MSFFTQINEAKHCAGTISLEQDLIFSLLDNICQEISRNGFEKILIINGHGGNKHLIPYFIQNQLSCPRDYVLYYAKPYLYEKDKIMINHQWQSLIDGHAGESETSQIDNLTKSYKGNFINILLIPKSDI
ncbi:MAG: creatininase family protein [Haliscomenobacter sp.]|nr:creatininase family protein [Haliscomenobacter sp.]